MCTNPSLNPCSAQEAHFTSLSWIQWRNITHPSELGKIKEEEEEAEEGEKEDADDSGREKGLESDAV